MFYIAWTWVTQKLGSILTPLLLGVFILGACVAVVHFIKEKGALEEQNKQLEATIEENNRLILQGQILHQQDAIQAAADASVNTQLSQRLAATNAYFQQREAEQVKAQADVAQHPPTPTQTGVAVPTPPPASSACFAGEDYKQLLNLWKR